MIYKTVFSFLVLSLFFNENAEAIKKAELCGNRLTPVFTPFGAKGELKTKAIPSIARFLISYNFTTFWVNAISSEPYSLNLAEQQANAAAWIRLCKANPIKCVIGVNFLPIRDACRLARYADSQNVAAIVHRPNTDAGPTNEEQMACDFAYVARCAPSTPVFLLYNPNFSCGRNINYGEVVRICSRTVPNFAGLIAPLETVLQARSYNANSTCDVQYIVFYYYAVSAANLLDFDAHSTPFASIFPAVVNKIDKSYSTRQSLRAQERLDELASPLCNLRPECRLTCPVNILKAAFTLRSGIQIGGTRSPPLCPVTRRDIDDVSAFLRSQGYAIRKPDYPYNYPSNYPNDYPSNYPSNNYPSNYPNDYPCNYPNDYPSNYPNDYPNGYPRDYSGDSIHID